MKFKIIRTSAIFSSQAEAKEFETLEGLMSFIKEVEAPIIIFENGTIEIYDEQRE